MNYIKNLFFGKNCRTCGSNLLKAQYFDDNKNYTTKYICPNCCQSNNIKEFVKFKLYD
jgi:hypothetical protein